MYKATSLLKPAVQIFDTNDITIYRSLRLAHTVSGASDLTQQYSRANHALKRPQFYFVSAHVRLLSYFSGGEWS